MFECYYSYSIKDGPRSARAGGNMVLVISRNYLRTTHEEADVILVQQTVNVAVAEGVECITVMSDDTDVVFLLLYCLANL